MKNRLTDSSVKALSPADPGSTYMVHDTVVPGFAVSVTAKGSKSFVLYCRFPGSNSPSRRTIGEVGRIGLAEARGIAKEWLALIASGIDPAKKAEAERQAIASGIDPAKKAEAEANSEENASRFARVAEDYIRRNLKGKRKAKDAEREIRNNVILEWGDKSVESITRKDVVRLIDGIVDRGAIYQAHNIFGHIRAIFNWAINRGIYGIEYSPCDRLKSSSLIGERAGRQRVLSDAEIIALWEASGAMGYPVGAMVRLLLLTGQRKSDVGKAVWSEFSLDTATWVIPAARFKMKTAQHVPLSDLAMSLLQDMPRWPGAYLFSFTGGQRAIDLHSRNKHELDARMEAILRRSVEPWVVHDIRRTVRTRLASLKIPGVVSEMVIGHAQKGIQKVYDQYGYEAEKREALEAWARRLRDLTETPPDNVVHLKAAATR